VALLGSTHNLTNVIGVVFQPLLFNIQKGKNPRGLGTKSPTQEKNRKAKKSHLRKVALKVG
jgi:hypothetical protein